MKRKCRLRMLFDLMRGRFSARADGEKAVKAVVLVAVAFIIVFLIINLK